jgi:hypothetical protein
MLSLFEINYLIIFLCSFLCLPKETNQRKGSLSLGLQLFCAACKEPATSESRTPLRGAPPSRFSDLCCAARLREMAFKNL